MRGIDYILIVWDQNEITFEELRNGIIVICLP